MEAKHTPTPWTISKIGNDYDEHMIYGESDPSRNICNTVYGEANAAFIVKACNGYEGLTRALYAAPDLPDDWNVGNPDAFKAFTSAYTAWLRERNEAIAKAEETGD